MDERFIETESFHNMNQIIKQAERGKGIPNHLNLEQFIKDDKYRLEPTQDPINDLLDSKKDRKLMPAKALNVNTSVAVGGKLELMTEVRQGMQS